MANQFSTRTAVAFDAPHLQRQLDEMSGDPGRYDELDFGVVAMDLEGTVVAYNRFEAEAAGIDAGRVLDANFFTDVAPCTNNYLVSGRFDDESTLDETIDYVFTLRMRPTPVRLRLLKDERVGRQYVLVER
ncbi:MAG: hypothetical protein NVS2B3_03320 [Vulcanimicrobiaceae bacterium]